MSELSFRSFEKACPRGRRRVRQGGSLVFAGFALTGLALLAPFVLAYSSVGSASPHKGDALRDVPSNLRLPGRSEPYCGLARGNARLGGPGLGG